MQYQGRKYLRFIYRPTGTLLAEGPVGWGIMPFEGNFYIRRKYLRTDCLRPNFIPGICLYKFLYVWLDLDLGQGKRARHIGWFYWLPNPLLPFIGFSVALPGLHPDIEIEPVSQEVLQTGEAKEEEGEIGPVAETGVGH